MLVGGIGVFVGRGVAVGVFVGGTGVFVGVGVAVGGTGVFVGVGVAVGGTGVGVFVGVGEGVGVLVGVAVGVAVAVGTGVLVDVGTGVFVGGTGVLVGEEPLPPPLPPPLLLVVLATPVVGNGPYEIGGIITLEASWALVTVSNILPIAGPTARTEAITTTATRPIKRLYSITLWPSAGRVEPVAVLIFFIVYLALAIFIIPL